MHHAKKMLATLTLAMGVVFQAQATTIALSADGIWNEFNVDDFSAISAGTEWIDYVDSNSPDFGTPLEYTFTIASGYVAKLTVVDAGFAGDTFSVYANNILLGMTSATTNSTDYSNDFDANLANSNFSGGVFTLAAGSYTVTGNLFSTTQAFNATNGALKLEVMLVPEADTYAMLLAGFGLMSIVRRRK